MLSRGKSSLFRPEGRLGSSWSINRTMDQVHAVLLVSENPLSPEDILEQLNVIRGNLNMNIRELLNWKLPYKEIVSGERREFFRAEKIYGK